MRGEWAGGGVARACSRHLTQSLARRPDTAAPCSRVEDGIRADDRLLWGAAQHNQAVHHEALQRWAAARPVRLTDQCVSPLGGESWRGACEFRGSDASREGATHSCSSAEA